MSTSDVVFEFGAVISFTALAMMVGGFIGAMCSAALPLRWPGARLAAECMGFLTSGGIGCCFGVLVMIWSAILA